MITRVSLVGAGCEGGSQAVVAPCAPNSEDGGMSDDDEIARLLREVDAATGGAAANTGDQRPAAAANPPARRDSASTEVAKEGSDSGAQLLIAGIAGAVLGLLAAWVFGIIPFLGNVETVRFLLAGFVGGAVGYGTSRILNRRKD